MSEARSILWTRRALRRLDQIGTYIAKDNPAAAAQIVLRISSAAGMLGVHPAAGRVGRIGGTRELVLADIPYVIAYRVQSDVIEILTIIHTAQQWPDEL